MARLTDAELVEEVVRETWPPGGEEVTASVDGGPPQPGIIYRVDKPFPRQTWELKARMRRFKFDLIPDGEGRALLTWAPIGPRFAH
jgi:hypothetical protein